jgi:hypothetical protein
MRWKCDFHLISFSARLQEQSRAIVTSVMMIQINSQSCAETSVGMFAKPTLEKFSGGYILK